MNVKSLFLAGAFLFTALSVAHAEYYPYKDSKLTPEERMKDLIGRMSNEEKMAQIRHLHSWNLLDGQLLDPHKLEQRCGKISWGFVEGFPLTAANSMKYFEAIQRYMVEKTRLGIPVFTVAESLHGVVQEGATIYPQNIALGSTFNKELAYRRAAMISDDLHAMQINQVLAPCIDVVRELRWGRVEESYGEDPFLCGIMAVEEVKGYMDHGISPMLKHYGPHGNPLGGLNLATVDCGIRDLLEVYLKPFEMVFRQTNVQAVMSSYNAWDRVPNSASYFLLTELLRKEYGFKGYVYSDWGVIDMLKTFHRTASDDADAARQALTAGLDVEASSDCYPSLLPLIEKGEMEVKYLDQAVERVLLAKFRLGLFEDPYGKRFGKKELHSASSRMLSKEIADESIVLLKNEGNLLPLNLQKLKSIAVIGPNADQVQFGDYTWSKENKDGVTPLEGIRRLVNKSVKVNYAPGCEIASLSETMIPEAVEAARQSEVAVVFVGSSSTAFVRYSQKPSTSGEGIDLHDISLTGAQEKLIRAVHATGTPTIVVLVSGKPFAIPWVKQHVPAVLAQWYGGEQSGSAIADLLFGKVNPSGKLTFSFPQSTGHLPAYYNHMPTDKGYYKSPGSYEKPGRDYVFSNPDPLWAFGHGLSYTRFEYVNAESDRQRYDEGDTIRVRVTVRNAGDRYGKEAVQLYVRDVVSSVMSPVKQLKAFEKVGVAPGQEVSCELKIPVDELRLMDSRGRRFLEGGVFELQVGAASDDIRRTLFVGVGEYAQSNGKKLEDDLQRYQGGAPIRITGTVRDVQATPIEGVEVKNGLGTKKAVTDKRGEYSIEVGEMELLIFWKKGFQKESIPVNGQKSISVKMNYSN